MILLLEAVFVVTLMRAMLVRANLLPASCGRCGLQVERRELGERVCRCGH